MRRRASLVRCVLLLVVAFTVLAVLVRVVLDVVELVLDEHGRGDAAPDETDGAEDEGEAAAFRFGALAPAHCGVLPEATKSSSLAAA